MFVNTYQSGYFLQVWDSRVNPQKNGQYKHLIKKIPTSLKNFYDKQVKSYIYELQSASKLMLPADDKHELGLHQRYLVLQIFIPIGAQWSLQIGFNDINANKKRVNITTNSGKQQLKYFSFRYPLESGALEKGIWSFLAVDLYSFCNAFKNTVYRSLDHILVHSSCKIRRIFTMKEWVQWQIPKNYWLAPGIPQTLQLIEFKQQKQQISNINNSLLNSSVQYSKLVESKINIQNQYLLRNSQKASPIQQKVNSQIYRGNIKLPDLNPRLKQSTPLKSSKLSQKVDNTLRNNIKDNSLFLNKSNRSLSKPDKIIQKSKNRLNSLQQRQLEILEKLKSEDKALYSEKLPNGEKLPNSEKVSKQTKAKVTKADNIFQSDLFKSQFSQSNQKLKLSPKLRVKKKFQQDNIFREQTYSSSISSHGLITKYQQSIQAQNQHQHKVEYGLSEVSINQDKLQNSLVGNFYRDKESRVKVHVGGDNRSREEIIQEDLWTEEEEDGKVQTPIEEMIHSQLQIQANSSRFLQSQNNIKKLGHNQTVISKQNNKQIILHKNELEPATNELELIYDQMVGCYYHPPTNTYYQITG